MEWITTSNKHWFGITQEAAWNGRSGYWKTCLDKLLSWKAKKGPEISDFHEILWSGSKYVQTPNPNKQEYPQCFTSPKCCQSKCCHPTFEQKNLNPKRFMTAFINMNQIYIDEPAVSVASHFLMSSSLNLQACQLCLGCGGNRGVPIFSPRQPVPVIWHSLQGNFSSELETNEKHDIRHITITLAGDKGSSSSYERPLKPLEPHRHVGKTCQNHIQIISPKHPLCQINNQNAAKNHAWGAKLLYVL